PCVRGDIHGALIGCWSGTPTSHTEIHGNRINVHHHRRRLATVIVGVTAIHSRNLMRSRAQAGIDVPVSFAVSLQVGGRELTGAIIDVHGSGRSSCPSHRDDDVGRTGIG